MKDLQRRLLYKAERAQTQKTGDHLSLTKTTVKIMNNKSIG